MRVVITNITDNDLKLWFVIPRDITLKPQEKCCLPFRYFSHSILREWFFAGYIDMEVITD